MGQSTPKNHVNRQNTPDIFPHGWGLVGWFPRRRIRWRWMRTLLSRRPCDHVTGPSFGLGSTQVSSWILNFLPRSPLFFLVEGGGLGFMNKPIKGYKYPKSLNSRSLTAKGSEKLPKAPLGKDCLPMARTCAFSHLKLVVRTDGIRGSRVILCKMLMVF